MYGLLINTIIQAALCVHCTACQAVALYTHHNLQCSVQCMYIIRQLHWIWEVTVQRCGMCARVQLNTRMISSLLLWSVLIALHLASKCSLQHSLDEMRQKSLFYVSFFPGFEAHDNHTFLIGVCSLCTDMMPTSEGSIWQCVYSSAHTVLQNVHSYLVFSVSDWCRVGLL